MTKPRMLDVHWRRVEMQVPLAFEYVIESQGENHRLEQDQDFELAGKWPNKSESDNRDERSEGKS